ncbi:MAG TPA: glutaredoxin family protein [Patescibacteria group bacterium]|nr:glutaredoxin family protein [Patescibacteria group bacterium]
MVVKVEGSKRGHKVFLYTLSTCGWCKKTKQFLKDNAVEYEYMDIDTCTSEERQSAIQDLKTRKAPLGFPLAIIDDETLISGFKPEKYKEVLNL